MSLGKLVERYLSLTRVAGDVWSQSDERHTFDAISATHLVSDDDCQPPRIGSVLLEWVLVDGERSHVSQFAEIAPPNRPRATCPHCRRRVRMKLGQKVAHHAAHEPRDACPLQEPESALHLNTKYYIAWQLGLAKECDRRIEITSTCLVGRRRRQWADVITMDVADHELDAPVCPNRETHAWLTGWDEVCVETGVSTENGIRRPDILLRSQGDVVAAIEVVVTHRIDEEKAQALASIGVPWVEVAADPAIFAYNGGWECTSPLPIVRRSDVRDWRCEQHQVAYARWLADEQRMRAEAAEHARHTVRIAAARVLDVYYPRGKWYRHIYRVEDHRTDGITHTVVLYRGMDSLIRVRLDDNSPPTRNAAWARVRARYDADVLSVVQRKNAIADSPMDWARGEIAEFIAAGTGWDWFTRDPHPLASRYPRRLFFAASRREWFMPREMREVRWDRPRGDAFDVHPAWVERKRAAQQREQDRPAARRSATSKATNSASFDRGRTVSRHDELAQLTTESTDSPFGIEPRKTVFELSPVPLAARLDADEFGAAVVNQIPSGTVTILELARHDYGPPRAIVLAHEQVTTSTVDRVEAILESAKIDHVWGAARYDWSRRFAHLPWVLLARDNHLRGLVVIGATVLLAAEFAEKFARAEDPCTSPCIAASGAAIAERLES